jgi:hypothetical protein
MAFENRSGTWQNKVVFAYYLPSHYPIIKENDSVLFSAFNLN